MSVKRKRMSFCRISSSSSEDGAAAAATESDLSDSTSDSRTHSAGEEEPPTKRKRDKALKTAAERNRKSGRMKAASPSTSPKHSAVQRVQREETASVQEPSAENLSCTQDNESDLLAKNSAESVETEQHLDRSTESSPSCVAENTTTDEVDKAAVCESVSSAKQSVDVDSDVAGKKDCTEPDCVTEPASKSSSDDETHHKECTDVKQNSCSTEANDVGKLGHDNTDSECCGPVGDNARLNAVCSEDKSADDEQSVDTEAYSKNDKGCENHVETRSDDVAEEKTVCLNISKDEIKSDKPVDKSTQNGHPACNTRKARGRPKKANKKSRKKREHSNVTNAASLTEVQETDCEPTKKKKLGRPSKKSQLAQLVAEQCDSLPQSEDDIPLIELRRSARANKGQRNIDQMLVLEQPKKRNRAKDDEKERKLAAKEEKRQKREAELQEQAALKAKKKKRGKSDSDDDFVPGKKGQSRKGRGAKKALLSGDESASSDATDEFCGLFESEEEELRASSSSSYEHLESDDGGSEYMPRGRNAQRAAAIKEKYTEVVEDGGVEDKPCTRCGKSNQPEWILLCDRCDAGYHTACLRPPIMVIPEDDWFCPLCEHNMLIEKLQEQLNDFDKKAKSNERLIQRKERLAYVTVNLSNILPEDERRAISNAFDADFYDDEASGEEEESSKAVPSSQSSVRKRASQRRRHNSSVSSSLISSDEEEEEELSDMERRHGRMKKVERLVSEDEENWSYARRSCRRQRPINYKFEEFDQLISGAIEDDVKEADPTPRPPRRSGKDMSNITGLCDLDDDKPATGKRKKRTRQLTKLDSDETEDDDSEEFQLSDSDEASTADEEADNVDDDLSDDWSVTRSSRWTSSRTTRRSNRQRQRSTRMNNFVSDDSEEYSDNDRSYHGKRRAAAKQRVNYHEISESDSAVSDTEQQSDTSRRKTAVKTAKHSNRIKDSDSEYQPSSAAEDAGAAAVLSSQPASRCKRLGFDSDESGSEAVSKKKGRLNRIMSSSDYSSSEDENVRTDGEKPNALNSDCQETPIVNGIHEGDTDAIELNAAAENKKGFTIASLLKTSDRTAISECNSKSSEEIDWGEEDSLSGIEDLVDYVTQS